MALQRIKYSFSIALIVCSLNAFAQGSVTKLYGAIIRGDTSKKELTIVFTGDEFSDGGAFIAKTLKKSRVKAAFFFTGRFYRNPSFKSTIRKLKKQGHYLGAHSNDHLLYADWTKRDSLLVTKQQFTLDLLQNYAAMEKHGISKRIGALFFTAVRMV